MPNAEERRRLEQNAREQLLTDNRAKFKRNRVVYVTPNGFHTTHDLDDTGLDELISQLKEAKFECRATTQRDNFTTNDWFKHGEKDWWESYVITRA